MNYFNGLKKSKHIMVAILMIALIATYGLPLAVYADDKPVWSDYENDPQTQISEDITDDVAEAQKQADLAEDAAQDAGDAADKAANEEQKAEEAADDAEDVADDADQLADEAEQLYQEGQTYINNTEKNIEDQAKAAKDEIEDKADEASAAADIAAQAALDAESQRVAAETATDSAAAEEAAQKASDAADLAEQKSQEADQAYQDALAKLEAARKAYEDAVVAALTQVNDYNTKIDEYKTDVNALDMEELKKTFDAAEKATNDAAAAADQAAKDAAAAADAAEIAANAAINYYVTPAQAAYENALKEQQAADDAKAAADKAVADEEADKLAKEAAYNSIIDSTTASAKAAQDALVAEKKAQMDAAKKAFENQSGWEKYWDELLNREEYKAWKDAEAAYKNAKSNSAYDAAVTTALHATPQYQALTAAQADLAKAKEDQAKKNEALKAAQTATTEKLAELNSAKKTRDDYLADIKASVGDEAAAKIIAALNGEVQDSVTDVNQTIFDEDLYSWASEVKDSDWWKIWQWDVYKDAKDTVEDINEEYTENEFMEWLDATFPWIHKVKNTDEIIAMAESAYRQELKQHEEELAFNQAYLAQVEAAKAAEEAAKKQAEAAAAVTKLAEAKERLAAAELKLAEAKERVNKLQELKLNTDAAFSALQEAQNLVNEAKEDKEQAADDAIKARDDADAAQAAADKLKTQEEIERTKVGYYQISYMVAGTTSEVAISVEGNTTSSSITVDEPTLLDNYKEYQPISADNALLNSDGTVTISGTDGGESQHGEHIVTVWYEKVTSEDNSEETGRATVKHSGSTAVIITDEAAPASPVTGQAVSTTEPTTLLTDAIPAGPLPKTGGIPAMFLYGLGALLAGSGVTFRKREKKN